MLRISEISFPGLGIGDFSANSVAFTLFKGTDYELTVAWYAIIITLGMIAGVLYTLFRSKKIGITTDDVIDFALFTIPIGVIGARLYYVLTKLEDFSSFEDVVNIRNGGLAIYGGILAGSLTVFVICRIKKISFFAFADCVVPGLILAQAIGRWGNMINGEAFGGETDIFCRMGINNILTSHQTIYVHPTFLYESLWNLLGFALVNIFYSKKQYDGQIFLAVFGWYGLGRMFIEGLRADSLYTSIFGISFRTSQVLACLILVICVGLLIFFGIKKQKGNFYFKSPSLKSKKEKD